MHIPEAIFISAGLGQRRETSGPPLSVCDLWGVVLTSAKSSVFKEPAGLNEKVHSFNFCLSTFVTLMIPTPHHPSI